MMASSRCSASVLSIPSSRASRRQSANACRYFSSVSGPRSCAITMISCPKYGITRSAWRSLNSITSASECTGASGPSAAR